MIWLKISKIFVVRYEGSSPLAALKEDNFELLKSSSLSGMTQGSFYFEREYKNVYVWPSESDNPNSNGKIYVFYTWLGFCEVRADYEIQGTESIYYVPAIDSANAPPYSEGVGELFYGSYQASFGDISLKNVDWFFDNLNNFIFIGSEVKVQYGIVGGSYSSYTPILYGQITDTQYSDGGINLSVMDLRERLFNSIPPDRFLKEEFPYIPDSTRLKDRPILLGEKKGIIPNLVNEIDYTYEISQINFDFRNFAGIQEITAVYKDGTLLTQGADYTADLPAGQFKLNSDPGGSVITADAKGLKCGYDWDLEDWTDTYVEDIASITYFYLRVQGMEARQIENAGFKELQALKAAIKCGDWMFKELDFKAKLPELQTTGLFHMSTTAAGKIKVSPYVAGAMPVAAIDNKYIRDATLSQSDQEILDRVIVRYNKRPQEIEEETEESGEPLAVYENYRRDSKGAAYLFQVRRKKSFKTICTDINSAEYTALEISRLYAGPPKYFTFQAPQEAITWNIFDRVTLTYFRYDRRGKKNYIFEDKPFIVVNKSTSWASYITITLREDPGTLSGSKIVDHNFIQIVDESGNNMIT